MPIIKRILLTMAGLLVIVYCGLIVYAYWPYGEGIPAADLAGPDDKFIRVANLQLRYRTWGTPQPDEPAFVLIHGFANSAMSFDALASQLAPDCYVIALDMPGFGLSDKPADFDYGNESQARVVMEFIIALGLEQVVIGGHSMGGAHAVHVALDAPQVVGMLLFNPGIINTGVPPATQYLVFPLPRLAAKTFAGREFRRSFLASSYVDPDIVTEEKLDELMLGPKSEGYIDGATTLMGYYKSGNEITLLDDIHIPTLIVWGADDKRKPRDEAELLQSKIADSRLVMVPAAGHYVHEEKPGEAAQAIREAKNFWAARR